MSLILQTNKFIGVVIPSGPLDASTVGPVKDQVITWWDKQPDLRQIVVDLSGVGFLDSAGLGLLISLVKRAATRGGDVTLVQAQPQVKMVLEITRVNKIFSNRGSAAV